MADTKTVTFDASQYQLVPKVPTNAQLTGIAAADSFDPYELYAAMLAGAPTPAAQSAGHRPVAVATLTDGTRNLTWLPAELSLTPGVYDIYAVPAGTPLIAPTPAAQSAGQEPYAYIYEYDQHDCVHRELSQRTWNGMKPSRVVKVYAAPVSAGQEAVAWRDAIEAALQVLSHIEAGDDVFVGQATEAISGLTAILHAPSIAPTFEQARDTLCAALDAYPSKRNAAPVNGGEREKPAPLFMTGWQLLEALDLVAPDRDTDRDQLDCEIALQMGDETSHSGPGLYAWEASEPEEGSSFLAGKRTAGKPSDCSGEPECCPQNEGYGCHCGTRNSDVQRAADASPTDYAALEREHFGDPDKRTGIYAERAADAPQVGDSPDMRSALQQALMALTGYLPAHRNAVTDAAIASAQAALSSPAKAGGERLTRDEVHAKALAMPDAGMADMIGPPPVIESAKVGGDEREVFEAKFPIPAHCERCGNGYVATSYNAWDAHKHVTRWEGWKAHAALSADGGERKDAYSDVTSMHRDFEEWAETKDFNESDGPYATPEANAAWAAWRECMDMRGTPDAQVIEVRLPQGGGAIVETRTQVQMLRPLPAGTKLYAAAVRENQEIAK